MVAPLYAVITEGSFRQASRGTQMDLVLSAIRDCPDLSALEKHNPTLRWRIVELARQVWYDWQQDRVLQPQTRAIALLQARAAGFRGITASECNEWLATLPPYPQFGEVAQ